MQNKIKTIKTKLNNKSKHTHTNKKQNKQTNTYIIPIM